MGIYKIDQDQAYEIAWDAMDNAGYNITQFSGYWQIWWCEDTEDDVDYAVAINKEQDDNGNDQHFAIYVSISGVGEGWWEFTDNLDVDELAEKLLKIAQDIETEEMERRGLCEKKGE